MDNNYIPSCTAAIPPDFRFSPQQVPAAESLNCLAYFPLQKRVFVMCGKNKKRIKALQTSLIKCFKLTGRFGNVEFEIKESPLSPSKKEYTLNAYCKPKDSEEIMKFVFGYIWGRKSNE